MIGVKNFRRVLLDCLKIVVGTLLGAAAFRYLTFPNNIVSGGVTGISQILNMLVGTPVGVTIIVLNIPLFWLAWKKMGKRFVLESLLCMLLSSLFIDLLELVPYSITSDPLLAAVYGGLVNGFGYGLVYTTGATGGGTDIPARLLRRRYPYINLSTFMLAINAVIIVTFAVIFRRFDSCMYTIIYMFISNKMVDLLLYGPVNSRLCYIVSDRSDDMKHAITEQLGRGATLLHGQGAWSGQEKQVILCVVKPQQIGALRRIVREVDLRAFLVVSDARGVYGRGFENIQQED